MPEMHLAVGVNHLECSTRQTHGTAGEQSAEFAGTTVTRGVILENALLRSASLRKGELLNQKLKWVSVAAGLIIFVALMAIREEVSYLYLRALLVGVAFAILVLPLEFFFREKKIQIGRRQKILTMAVCIVIFGIAMGIQQDLPAMWMRISIAALGGVFWLFFMWIAQQQGTS